MNDSVRIRFSWGLLGIALSQVVAFAGFGLLAPKLQQQPADRPGWDLPIAPANPQGQIGYYESLKKLNDPPEVNLKAQGEMKQQAPCIPCQTQQRQPQRPTGNSGIVLRPGERLLSINPVTTRPFNPANLNPWPLSNPWPLLNQYTPQAAQPKAPLKKYQVALFLDHTAQSVALAHWFDNYPDLMVLKSSTDFQIYTPAKELYKARYQSIVPVDQFPCVLFLDSQGGHIHAAGKSMLPQSPQGLVADMQKGLDLYKQAKEAPVMSGAIKTAGYSWDDSINPAMTLQSSDCDDGYCPQPTLPEANWRPGQNRVNVDLFGPRSPGPGSGIFQNAQMIGTLVMFAIAAVLFIHILNRRSD